MNRIIGFLSLVLLNANNLIAQNFTSYNELNSMKVIPPSPNASALGKFGDIPVSYYTGIPQINIPIWTFQEGGQKIPISLSYHAGGVKVEEIASNVGQGWALNSGGVITRTVRGMPDDQEQVGWMYSPNLPLDLINASSFPNANSINDGLIDAEHDIFTFNFNGTSGKFFIDKTGKINQIPYTRIRIEPVTGLLDIVDSYGNIKEWKLTNTDGTVYIFNVQEYSKSYVVGSTAQAVFPLKPVITSWYLKRIITSTGVVIANYEYETYEVRYRQKIGEIKYDWAGWGEALHGMQDQPEPFMNNEVQLKRISKINLYSGSKANFLYEDGDNFRCDYVGDKALRKIEIINSKGDFVKGFNFYFTYNGIPESYNTCQVTGTGFDLSDETKRLMLDRIQEVNKNNDPAQEHTFEYHPIFVSRISRSQDHWGFYNGQPNQTLIPPSKRLDDVWLPGADRNAYAEYAVAGVLKKINYPTGGYTAFEYESNDQANHYFIKYDH